MTITKREYSAIDAQPVVPYAKQDGDSVTAYPLTVTGGSLKVTNPAVERVNTHTGDTEIRVFQANHVCLQNTSTTPLGANATFTGEWQDCLNYQEVNVSVATDQNSAVNGMVVEWSADGVLVGDDDKFTVYANAGTNYTPNPAFRYVRVKYTNGSTPQTIFSIMTILRRGVTGGSFHRIDSTLKDDSDGRLTLTVPKLKTSANNYVSQTATSAGNAKMSLEELESGISVNNKTQLKTTLYDPDGNPLYYQPRRQSPTGSVLQVQIGAGDIISNLPVVVDLDHHQVHEGETFRSQFVDTSLDTNTIKFAIVVKTYVNPSAANCPHMVVGADVYNGAARIDIYEGATYTGGTPLTAWNRERNITGTAATITVSGVTSTNGSLVESFFVGQGSRTAGANRNSSEFVLKSNTTYRVDVIGLAAGTDVIVAFDWYEDLGV